MEVDFVEYFLFISIFYYSPLYIPTNQPLSLHNSAVNLIIFNMGHKGFLHLMIIFLGFSWLLSCAAVPSSSKAQSWSVDQPWRIQDFQFVCFDFGFCCLKNMFLVLICRKLPVNQGGALSPSCFSLSGPLSLSQKPRPHFYDFCTTPWLHGFEGSKKKFSNFPLCFHLNFLDCFKV